MVPRHADNSRLCELCDLGDYDAVPEIMRLYVETGISDIVKDHLAVSSTKRPKYSTSGMALGVNMFEEALGVVRESGKSNMSLSRHLNLLIATSKNYVHRSNAPSHATVRQ